MVTAKSPIRQISLNHTDTHIHTCADEILLSAIDSDVWCDTVRRNSTNSPFIFTPLSWVTTEGLNLVHTSLFKRKFRFNSLSELIPEKLLSLPIWTSLLLWWQSRKASQVEIKFNWHIRFPKPKVKRHPSFLLTSIAHSLVWEFGSHILRFGILLLPATVVEMVNSVSRNLAN